jgi:hypothetical protein
LNGLIDGIGVLHQDGEYAAANLGLAVEGWPSGIWFGIGNSDNRLSFTNSRKGGYLGVIATQKSLQRGETEIARQYLGEVVARINDGNSRPSLTTETLLGLISKWDSGEIVSGRDLYRQAEYLRTIESTATADLGKNTALAGTISRAPLVPNSQPDNRALPSAGNSNQSLSPGQISTNSTTLNVNIAISTKEKIKFPSSANAKQLLEFSPPRSANACIGTKKSGKYFLITSSCSQPVLAVTKGTRANGSDYGGYFLASHYFLDPVYPDNEVRHDGEVETTSCFRGDKYCTMGWLETLQQCKVWGPGPKASAYYGQPPSHNWSFPLDCAPDMSTRTPNSLWDEFNRELIANWDKYLDQNLASKMSSNDQGATLCAVQLFVPLLQIRLDTMYKHQQLRGIPHSTCDSSVFGTH